MKKLIYWIIILLLLSWCNMNTNSKSKEIKKENDITSWNIDEWFWMWYNIPWPKDTLNHLSDENQEYIQKNLWSKMQIIWTGNGYSIMKADFYGIEIPVPNSWINYWWFSPYEKLHIYPSNDKWEQIPENDITIKFLKNWFLDKRKNWWWNIFEQSYNEAEKELTNMYEWYKEKFWSWNAETYRLSFEKDATNNQIIYTVRNIISPYLSWANAMYVVFIKNPDPLSNQWINTAYIWKDDKFDYYVPLLQKMISGMKIDRNFKIPSQEYLIENKLIWWSTHMIWEENNFETNKEVAIKNSNSELSSDYSMYILYYIKDLDKRYSKFIYKPELDWPLSAFYFDPINNKKLWNSKPAPRSSEQEKSNREKEYSDKRWIQNLDKSVEITKWELPKLPNLWTLYNKTDTKNSVDPSKEEKETLIKIRDRYINHSIPKDEAEKIVSDIYKWISTLSTKQRKETLDNLLKQLK